MEVGYSHELHTAIFDQPYTRIQTLVDRGIARRATASKYLKELERIKILESVHSGRDQLYLNLPLLQALSELYVQEINKFEHIFVICSLRIHSARTYRYCADIYAYCQTALPARTLLVSVLNLRERWNTNAK